MSFQCEGGLRDGAVLQRDRHGRCDLRLAVTSEIAAGEIEWRADRPGHWESLGHVVRGRATARLRGLPTGGPYTLELRIRASVGKCMAYVRFQDVWVGDIWVLGGQSNMQGSGLLGDRLVAKSAIRACYTDGKWAPAVDPIHASYQPALHTVRGTTRLPVGVCGVGPGVAMAQALWEATGVPQGLIPCARGGSTMAQWDPHLQQQPGCLYGNMMRRIHACGGRVAGLAWYQGENEATPAVAKEYTRTMQAWIQAFRRDVSHLRAPVVIAQLSRVAGWETSVDPFWTSVREQQRRLPETIRSLSVVSTIDLTFGDPIHIAAASAHRLGRRMARALESLGNARRRGISPIALHSIKNVPGRNGLCDVVVRFRNVTGGLRTGGDRPHGFCLADPEPFYGIFAVDLHKDRAILHTRLSMPEAEGMSLYYGYGLDPYCNLVDEADHAVPGFGPVAIGQPRALTAYARSFRISGFLPADPQLNHVSCPDLRCQAWEWRQFPDRLANRMEAIARTQGQTGVFYYACCLTCAESMRLDAVMGYDGPVKVWVDQQEVYHDPEGTNPATPLDARFSFEVSAGSHEVVVALGNNDGKAWGIYLRFERPDLPAHVLQGDTLAEQLPVLSA